MGVILSLLLHTQLPCNSRLYRFPRLCKQRRGETLLKLLARIATNLATHQRSMRQPCSSEDYRRTSMIDAFMLLV